MPPRGKITAPGPVLYPVCGTAQGIYQHRKHGTPRCAPCRAFNAEQTEQIKRDIYLRRPRLVPARGSQRRLRALMAIGWPLEEMARMWGIGRTVLQRVLHPDTVKVSRARAELIEREYRRLAFAGAGPSARARTWARNRGFPGPMDWDDIDRQEREPVPGYVIERDHQEALVIDRAVKKMLAKRERRSRLTPADRQAARARRESAA